MNYHDQDYDGILLKIPSGFIATNPDLIPAIDRFRKELEACRFSIMHPSYNKNLIELKEYKAKHEYAVAERKREEKEEATINQRTNDLVNHVILPISHKKLTPSTDHNYITINRRDYDWDEMCNKLTLKSYFIKDYKKYVSECTLDEFMYFLADSGFAIAKHLISDMHESLISYQDSYLYLDSCANISLSIDLPVIQVHFRGKRRMDKVYYNSPYLYYDQERKTYYIHGGILPESEKYTSNGSVEIRSYLDDYERKGNSLIKKD